MNILELPKELLIEIWSYVTKIEDIVRFGATSRRIQQLAFEVQDRDLVLTEYAKRPFEALRFIFSRDLRHLRKLSIGLAEQSDSWLNEHIQVLTTLHNLKKLRIRFVPLLGYSIRKEILSTFGQTVCDIVKKMTWLEQLGTSFPKHTNYSILLSHQKLTKLDVLTKDKGKGYNYLTQLRAIATPISTEDSVFEQILDLDNLTSLDISWSNITPEAAINLTRLTNLAKINIGGLDISYDIIKKLPKLYTLIDDRNNFVEEDFESLNQITQLTRLEIDTEQRMIQTEDFSDLTNLRELQFSSAFWWPEAFDTFKHLTLLQIKNFFVPNELLEPARFPQLKVFEMTACDCEIPLDIFNIDSIEELRIKWTEKAAEPVNLLQISRLTNLKSLRLARQFPTGLGKSLAVLPHLRNMWMYKIYQQNIEELKLVTQLCQLTYLEADAEVTLSTIRQKLPIIVYKQG